MLLRAFLAGYGADGVLSQQARTLLGHSEVPLQEVFVVLHLADLIQLLDDRLLSDLQDLDFAGLVRIDGKCNKKLDVYRARTTTAFAGLEVAHFGHHVVVGGLFQEAEGLVGAVAAAPALVPFEGFVAE